MNENQDEQRTDSIMAVMFTLSLGFGVLVLAGVCYGLYQAALWLG